MILKTHNLGEIILKKQKGIKIKIQNKRIIQFFEMLFLSEMVQISFRKGWIILEFQKLMKADSGTKKRFS